MAELKNDLTKQCCQNQTKQCWQSKQLMNPLSKLHNIIQCLLECHITCPWQTNDRSVKLINNFQLVKLEPYLLCTTKKPPASVNPFESNTPFCCLPVSMAQNIHICLRALEIWVFGASRNLECEGMTEIWSNVWKEAHSRNPQISNPNPNSENWP